MLTEYKVIDHGTGASAKFFEESVSVYGRLKEILDMIGEYEVDANILKKNLSRKTIIMLSYYKRDKAFLKQQGNVFHIYPIG